MTAGIFNKKVVDFTEIWQPNKASVNTDYCVLFRMEWPSHSVSVQFPIGVRSLHRPKD